MQFTLFGFPVRVEPWFWLSAALLGGGLRPEAFSSAANLASIGIWVILAFFSVLCHELGHASAGRRFGSTPVIVLQGFGGAAIMDISPFSRWQHFLMVTAGPAASACLAALSYCGLFFIPNLDADVSRTLHQLATINVFWTILNLLPVQPLDGGQMLRVALGERRFGVSCVVGVTVAVAVALWGLREGAVFLTLMMALFAYENWRAWRR